MEECRDSPMSAVKRLSAETESGRFAALVFAFCAEMGLDMIYFTIPLYASILGAGPVLIGLLGSAYGMSYVFVAFLGPRLYGSVNRDLLLVASLAGYTVLISLYLILRTPFYFFLVRLGEGVALGVFWPIADTVASDNAMGERMIGWYNTGWSVAAVAAPYLSGFMIAETTVIAPVAGAMAFEAFDVVFVFAAIRVPKHVQHAETKLPRVNSVTLFSVGLPAFVSAFLAGVVLTIYPPFLAGLRLPYTAIGLIAGSAGLTRTFMFAGSVRVEETVGKSVLAILGFGFLSFIALNSFTDNPYLLLASMLLVGIGLGALFHVGLDNALADTRNATANVSLFEASLGAGLLAGPLVAGILEHLYRAESFAAIATVPVACVLLYSVSRRARSVGNTGRAA
ncbi:MAG: MFS transporter [Thermoprotei archaeon]